MFLSNIRGGRWNPLLVVDIGMHVSRGDNGVVALSVWRERPSGQIGQSMRFSMKRPASLMLVFALSLLAISLPALHAEEDEIALPAGLKAYAMYPKSKVTAAVAHAVTGVIDRD